MTASGVHSLASDQSVILSRPSIAQDVLSILLVRFAVAPCIYWHWTGQRPLIQLVQKAWYFLFAASAYQSSSFKLLSPYIAKESFTWRSVVQDHNWERSLLEYVRVAHFRHFCLEL